MNGSSWKTDCTLVIARNVIARNAARAWSFCAALSSPRGGRAQWRAAWHTRASQQACLRASASRGCAGARRSRPALLQSLAQPPEWRAAARAAAAGSRAPRRSAPPSPRAQPGQSRAGRCRGSAHGCRRAARCWRGLRLRHGRAVSAWLAHRWRASKPACSRASYGSSGEDSLAAIRSSSN